MYNLSPIQNKMQYITNKHGCEGSMTVYGLVSPS